MINYGKSGTWAALSAAPSLLFISCLYRLLIEKRKSVLFAYYQFAHINRQINNLKTSMGNKTERPSLDSQRSSSQPTLEIRHPRLAKSKLIVGSSENDPSYLQLVQSVPSREVYEKWKVGIEKYQVPATEIETILLPKFIEFEEKGICGSSGILKSKYAVVPYVLNKEIENRRAIKQPFLEQQIWYLLYVTNLAAATAHSRGLVLGDVRPENVLMSNDGETCVSCLETFPDQQKNYYKSLITRTSTYLSPQQMQDLQNHKQEPTQSQQQSENFSVGLTILSALVLKDELDLYKIQDGSFNESELKSDIDQLRNSRNYGPLLKQIVEGLLQFNPKNRLKSQQVIRILKAYEDNIVNLQTFEVDPGSVPSEIIQKLNRVSNISISGVRSEKSNGDYRRVINSNDFNKNSRIQYASPRGSGRPIGQESQYPIYQNSNYPHIPQPLTEQQFNRQSKQLPSNAVMSQQVSQQQPIKVTETLYMQRPAQNSFVSSSPPPPNQRPVSQVSGYPHPSSLAVDSFVLSQSIPIRPNQLPPPQMRYQGPPPQFQQQQPGPLAVSTQQSQIYNSSLISSPDVANYISNIHSFIPNQYEQVRNYNTKQDNQNRKSNSSPQQENKGNGQTQHTQAQINNAQINNQMLQQDNRLQRGPFQYSQTGGPSSTQFQQQLQQNQMNRLTQVARQANSLRPPQPPFAFVINSIPIARTSATGNQSIAVEKYDKSKDKIFESYDQIMKNIDQRLHESKLQFPDDV